MGSYLLFIAMLLLPYLLAIGIYFVAFRVAGRMQSPVRPLVLHTLIGSALLCAAFLIWTQFQWASMGPTGKALTIAFLPFYVLVVMVIGLIVSWALVYVVRFIQERFWKWEPRLTRLVFVIPAVLILAFTGWHVQSSVRRSILLNAASSESESQESRHLTLNRALQEHDVEVMALLAANPQSSTADLVRIYDECKPNFNQRPEKDYRVFHALARNPHTPSDILVDLAKANESSTRTAVAENPNTPEAVLRQLASDPDDLVRTWLTHNPNLPKEVLVQMLEDRDEVVRNHAKGFMEHRGFTSDAGKQDPRGRLR